MSKSCKETLKQTAFDFQNPIVKCNTTDLKTGRPAVYFICLRYVLL